MGDKQYILKVLSGPHMGAEAVLREGRCTIGSHEECDIILTDVMVAPRHLQIFISSRKMDVSALEEKVYLDGACIPEDGAPLSVYQVMTLGTTHLSLGPADANWPRITLPDIQPEEDPLEDESELPLEADDACPAEPETPSEERMHRSRLHVPLLLVAALLLVGLIAITLSRLMDEADAELQAAGEPAKIRQRIEAVCNKPEYAQVKIISDPDGRFLLDGYVAAEKQKLSLLKALNGVKQYVTVRVRSNEEIAESCRRTLENLGLNLNVQIQDHGNLVLQGYLISPDALNRALTLLQQDTPGVSNIENRVKTPDVFVPELFDLLRRHGLGKRIDINVHPAYIEFKGVMPPEGLRKWREARAEIDKVYGGSMAIRENFNIIQPEKLSGTGDAAGESDEQAFRRTAHDKVTHQVNLPIKSVSMGKLRYLTMENGAIYFEGGRTGRGYIIKSIESDRIRLLINGKEHSFYLGGTQ